MDEYLIAHLNDLKESSLKNDYFVFSNFLSLQEQAYLKRKEPHLLVDGVLFPNDEKERKILCFNSSYASIEESIDLLKPIALLKIYPKNQKFAETISHRDVLGALLSLGIKREMIGDIYVDSKTAYAYVISSIIEEIKTNLASIKRNQIKIEILNSLDCPIKTEYIEKTISVSSNRIDSIISEVFSMSREVAKKHIEAGDVYSNEHDSIKNDISLMENEIISVRGYGRFCYIGEIGTSKKGKLRIKIKMPK